MNCSENGKVRKCSFRVSSFHSTAQLEAHAPAFCYVLWTEGNCYCCVQRKWRDRKCSFHVSGFLILLVWKLMHHFAVCCRRKGIAIGNCNGNSKIGNVLSIPVVFMVPFSRNLMHRILMCVEAVGNPYC